MKRKMKMIIIALVAIFAVSASLVVFSSDDDADGALIKTAGLSLRNDDYETVGETYTKVIEGGGFLQNKPQSYSISGASWLSITKITAATIELEGKIPFAGTYDITVRGTILLGLIETEWRWKITASEFNSTLKIINKDNVLYSVKKPVGSTVTLPTIKDTSSEAFIGYYTSASGGTKVADSGDKYFLSNKTETLYAQWKISFNMGDYKAGSPPWAGVRLMINDPTLLSDKLELYSLSGPSWLKISKEFYGLSIEGRIPDAGTYDVVVRGVINYGADEAEWKWRIIAHPRVDSKYIYYTLKIMDEDKVVHTTSNNEGSTIRLPIMTDTESKIFDGYYTAESGGTRVGGSGDKYITKGTETLYVRWTTAPIPLYTIKFDANGGNNDIGDVNVLKGSAIKLPSLTRLSFIFSGWNEGSKSGRFYSPGDTYIPTQSTTLYAKWIDIHTTEGMNVLLGMVEHKSELKILHQSMSPLASTVKIDTLYIPEPFINTIFFNLDRFIDDNIFIMLLQGVVSLLFPAWTGLAQEIFNQICTTIMWVDCKNISTGNGVELVITSNLALGLILHWDITPR